MTRCIWTISKRIALAAVLWLAPFVARADGIDNPGGVAETVIIDATTLSGGTVEQLLKHKSDNTIGEVTKGNSCLYLTNGSGVTSCSTTIPAFTLGGTIAGGGNQLNNIIIGTSTPLAGTFTTAVANSFVPNAATVPSNGLYLPAANTLGWATNSAAELQLTSTALSPAADGGNALGTTALGWSNAFFASGAALNFANGNFTATHASGQLSFSGNLGLNGANPASIGVNLFITSSAAFGGQLAVQNTANDATAPYWITYKDRAGGAVQAGDALGNMLWYGKDSSGTPTNRQAVIIISEANTVGTGFVQGKIRLQTSDASNVVADRITVLDTLSTVTTIWSVTNATDSTSTTTGSLQVAGGAAVRKRVWMDGLTAASGTPTSICRNANEITVNAALTCTVSAREFKDNIRALPDMSGALMMLQPRLFEWKARPGKDNIGFIADEVAAADPLFAAFRDNGAPFTWHLDAVIVALVQGYQQLRADNDNLRRDIVQLKVRHAGR